MRIFKNVFLLLLLALPVSCLLAQTEVNLRINPDQTGLVSWLRSHPGPLSEQQIATEQPQNSFLLRASHNQPLVPGETTSQLANLFTLRFNTPNQDSLLNALQNNSSIDFAELNHSRTVSPFRSKEQKTHPALPNPFKSGERANSTHKTVPGDPKIEEQWYHEYIRTFEAWDSTKGSSGVTIGILDTGLDYTHPEFSGQLRINAPEDLNGNGTFEPWPDSEIQNGISGDLDGLDQDGNGFADDVIGYDFTDQPRSPFGGDYLTPDPDPRDDNDHGTLVAGIVGAKANNGQGGAGIAPDCRLLVLRAFSANGAGEDDDVARAIIYAADNGVDVLNFSFGDIYPSLTMHEAIRYAYAKGVVMVASAGNGTGDELHYPSNFNEVISVSASTLNGSNREILWPLSSYGLNVALAAPGDNVLCPVVQDSTRPDPYDFFSGTSTAAPMVSAAAGLLLSQRGNCTPEQIRGLLTASADDISSTGWDHLTGAGRLNLENALLNLGGTQVQITGPENDRGTAEDTLWIIGTVFEPQLTSYTLEYQSGTFGNTTWTHLHSGNQQVFVDTLFTWNVSALVDGDYTLRLRADKSDGSTSEDRIRVVIDRSPPEIEVKVAGPTWDNAEQKQLIVFRSSDRGLTQLHFRSLNQNISGTLSFDRFTRNGDFLLGSDAAGPALPLTGEVEFQLESTNASGLSTLTPPDTLNLQRKVIRSDGFDTTGAKIPFGYYLSQTVDLDNDGLQEVVMSEYDENLSFGPVKYYEYNAVEFVEVAKIDQKEILIPKVLADVLPNGNMELLCSVNDSMYLMEPAAGSAYPTQTAWSEEGQGRYAATIANVNATPEPELLVKDFQDYYVYAQGSGPLFQEVSQLQDNSPDYQGSIAPRVLTGDFDGDGLQEVVYGDFDGDLLVYENSSANDFNLTFLDTTDLQKSGSYLCQGDFDGDGMEEIFVASHTSSLRNDDFEYDTPYWQLRIFKSTGNDAFSVVWSTTLYDKDVDSYNAATAGNIDNDPETELIFSTFPRTYLIDHSATDGYYFRWFHYGSLQTHHVIGDVNGNGVNEFSLGTGEKTEFWEFDFNYSGPGVPPLLEGHNPTNTSASLTWLPAEAATDYIVWRGDYLPGNTLISRVDSTANLTFSETGLQEDQTYLYVVQAKKNGLPDEYSDFSNAVLITPHAPVQLDSARSISDRQLQVWFTQPVVARERDLGSFTLNSSAKPISLIETAAGGNSLLLTFAEQFQPGTNSILMENHFQDALGGYPGTLGLSANFTWLPDSTDYVFFTHWEATGDKTALLHYNLPLDNSALDAGFYSVEPSGSITSIAWAGTDNRSVEVTVTPVNFGALGAPVSIIAQGVTAQNGATTLEKSGNIATFTSNAEELSDVYVYPNPWRPHQEFSGVRFANLTQNASITIFNASGRKVATLEEADGDGGANWDLRDLTGTTVLPGVYLFRVTNPAGEEFVGKFSILE